jgi:hypothetical protein
MIIERAVNLRPDTAFRTLPNATIAPLRRWHRRLVMTTNNEMYMPLKAEALIRLALSKKRVLHKKGSANPGGGHCIQRTAWTAGAGCAYRGYMTPLEVAMSAQPDHAPAPPALLTPTADA